MIFIREQCCWSKKALYHLGEITGQCLDSSWLSRREVSLSCPSFYSRQWNRFQQRGLVAVFFECLRPMRKRRVQYRGQYCKVSNAESGYIDGQFAYCYAAFFFWRYFVGIWDGGSWRPCCVKRPMVVSYGSIKWLMPSCFEWLRCLIVSCKLFIGELEAFSSWATQDAATPDNLATRLLQTGRSFLMVIKPFQAKYS